MGASRARGLDAFVGRLLRIAQDLEAIREERRVAAAGVEAPIVELAQVSQEQDQGFAFDPRQSLEPTLQFGVAQ